MQWMSKSSPSVPVPNSEKKFYFLDIFEPHIVRVLNLEKVIKNVNIILLSKKNNFLKYICLITIIREQQNKYICW